MGVFLSEYNDIDIDSSMGSLELQLLIETSFYKHPSVCFKLCRRDDNRWCLLWKYENNINDYYSVSRDVTRELGKPEMKMAEIMKEPVFIKKMKEFGTTYSYELSEDDALIIKEFLEKRLPSVSGHKPVGLDGHSYYVTLPQLQEKYDCWSVLPKEWTRLGDIIDICIKYANLDVKEYGYSIAK